jgi:hypothetical protein
MLVAPLLGCDKGESTPRADLDTERPFGSVFAQVALEVDALAPIRSEGDHRSLGRERAGTSAGTTATALVRVDVASARALVDSQGWLIPTGGTGIVAGRPVALLAHANVGKARHKVIIVHPNARQLGVALVLVEQRAGDLAFSAGETELLIDLDDARALHLE